MTLKKITLKLCLLFINTTLVLFLISCKTHQHQSKPDKKQIKSEGPEFLFSKLKENEFKFNEFSARFEANISIDGNTNSFKGNIKIKKDSIIWASITPLFGIEVFRAVFTLDSVKILNKLNNTYFTGNYNYLNEIFNTPFDYDMIQSLVTGNDFSFYETDIFKAGIDAYQYKLSTLNRRKIKKYIKNQSDIDKVLIQDIWLNSENFKIEKQSWKELKKQNSKLEIQYSDFIQTQDEQLFPLKLTCDISAENKMKFTVTYDKIQLNKPFEYPFVIPSSFTPIIK